MNQAHLARAALLAAALVAAAPSPAQAQDRRPSQLLKIFMLLKGAGPAQPMTTTAGTRTGHVAARPAKPTVSRPARTELLAARGDDASARVELPVAADPSLPTR